MAATQRWLAELGYPVIEGPTLQPSGANGVRYLMIAGPDGDGGVRPTAVFLPTHLAQGPMAVISHRASFAFCQLASLPP
ncbi:hypothetical protein J4732_22040 [Serratia marcescens]|uniref:Uncharacterized protein n=1 Tax=Serratia marcescens TaxID=615 RepID=A0A939NKT2_SERMA|nr:hypothetical protein [Serratia marcescens]